MNMFQVIFVVIVVCCVWCPQEATTAASCGQIPLCAVTPDRYNNALRGIVKFLYTFHSDELETISCGFEKYGHLDESQVSANYSVSFIYGGELVEESGTVLLTMNGIRAFVDSNKLEISDNTNYFSAEETRDGVIVIIYCNREEAYVGCDINNCGPKVKKEAEKVAETIAQVGRFKKVNIDSEDCPNDPRQT